MLLPVNNVNACMQYHGMDSKAFNITVINFALFTIPLLSLHGYYRSSHNDNDVTD